MVFGYFLIISNFFSQKIIEDLRTTTEWLQKHISDYSCFQYRQHLFNFVHSLHNRNNRINHRNNVNHKTINNHNDGQCDFESSNTAKFSSENDFLKSLDRFASNTNHSQSNSHLNCSLRKFEQSFFDEFILLDSLWKFYPDQECLYLHRRYILKLALKWFPERLDTLEKQEFEFNEKILKGLILNRPKEVWLNEMINRYRSFLKHHLNNSSFECQDF